MILTFVEHADNAISAASLEALTLARQLAETRKMPLGAILMGNASESMIEELGAFGVTELHCAQSPAFSARDSSAEYAPAAYAASLVELTRMLKPEVVLAPGSERGNEILAHTAARMDLPMAANCVAVNLDDACTVTRLRWGGSLLEEAQLDGAIKLVTVAPNAVPAERCDVTIAAHPQTVAVRTFTPQLDENDFRAGVTSRTRRATSKVSLGEARVVVGGGRGVGSAEGFRDLEELADLVGGAVGASRAVTSLGWRAHADQIGQTGTRIAPELYIACGVSGAIQHMIGCKGAKHILAINTDPEAPIMAKADYVVVGDLHQVLPAISAALKKSKM